MRRAAIAIILAILIGTGLLLYGATLTEDEVLQQSPGWYKKIAAYTPNRAAIEKLRKVNTDYKILVIFGYWCKDSQKHVPEFIKTMWEAGNPRFTYEFIEVPKERALRQVVYRKYNIERIPTFIVYKNGVEVGRIIEHPTRSIEEDLAEIIR